MGESKKDFRQFRLILNYSYLCDKLQKSVEHKNRRNEEQNGIKRRAKRYYIPKRC